MRFGSVTFAQRFGSALNLNPHFHTLALDGVYKESDGEPCFHLAPILTDNDVCQIIETTAQRVIRLLERRGVLDGALLDRLADEEPVLAGVTAASVRGMIATGERAGMRVRRVLSDPAEAVRTGYLCYASRGFSLHAATYVEGGDKDGLERLCRYPPAPRLRRASRGATSLGGGEPQTALGRFAFVQAKDAVVRWHDSHDFFSFGVNRKTRRLECRCRERTS